MRQCNQPDITVGSVFGKALILSTNGTKIPSREKQSHRKKHLSLQSLLAWPYREALEWPGCSCWLHILNHRLDDSGCWLSETALSHYNSTGWSTAMATNGDPRGTAIGAVCPFVDHSIDDFVWAARTTTGSAHEAGKWRSRRFNRGETTIDAQTQTAVLWSLLCSMHRPDVLLLDVVLALDDRSFLFLDVLHVVLLKRKYGALCTFNLTDPAWIWRTTSCCCGTGTASGCPIECLPLAAVALWTSTNLDLASCPFVELASFLQHFVTSDMCIEKTCVLILPHQWIGATLWLFQRFEVFHTLKTQVVFRLQRPKFRRAKPWPRPDTPRGGSVYGIYPENVSLNLPCNLRRRTRIHKRKILIHFQSTVWYIRISDQTRELHTHYKEQTKTEAQTDTNNAKHT